jgi:hypothetical protein
MHTWEVMTAHVVLRYCWIKGVQHLRCDREVHCFNKAFSCAYLHQLALLILEQVKEV